MCSTALVGGVRFYQRREVKDLIAYLRLVHNPLDEVSLARVINVPSRGIGAKSISELSRWAEQQDISLMAAMQRVGDAVAQRQPCPAPLTNRAAQSISRFVTMLQTLIDNSLRLPIVDLIDLTLEETGYRAYLERGGDSDAEERWENILEFRDTAQEFNAETLGEGLASMLERVSLVADVDSYEESEDSLTLITLHQAKGLEFPVVFIVGLEEGLLPHSRSMESEEELEEERRLCYVGITRAQRKLYLLRAFRRGMWGNSRPTTASRFLREIPDRLVESASKLGPQGQPARTPSWTSGALSNAAQPAAAPSRPVPHIGELVRHAVFGEGVVMECVEAMGDHEVTVHFEGDVGIKRLLLSFARLEKVEG